MPETLDTLPMTGPMSTMQRMGHEQLVYCHDEASGLRAIIGIHSTVLGPALGGTRMWNYASEDQAVMDVLRLSQGMTYKASVAGLDLGGGKAVILGDARQHKSEALFKAYGRFVNSLSGKYITAEDVGTSKSDMEWIATETKHVSGLPESMGGSGDPSPVTAFGVYMGMKAGARVALGNDSLEGRKILVQGVGNVGTYLVEHLVAEGAHVWISDVYEPSIQKLLSRFPQLQVCPSDQVATADVDIYAPCALGATLNAHSIAELRCALVAGGANNQLATDEDMQRLMDRSIAYAPDFVINAGGLINVYAEIKRLDREWALQKTRGIYDQTLAIFEQAAQDRVSTNEAAVRLAHQRLTKVAHDQQASSSR
ncbi:MAG: Glu/Leu/Phe/Val dehydrogenase dimerization domain-containing protein [Bacteroidota bacterium]|jgi:leucine dehydrogenase